MKIEKISKKKSNMYQILLSDNTSLSFYDDTIIYYNLLLNKEFTSKEFTDMVAYNHKIEAYYKALAYIKTKLRTQKEVTAKLHNLGYDNKTIDTVIAKLIKQNYLNDDLYLKSYIVDRINLTLKGPKKIVGELLRLGFNEIDIVKNLAEYPRETWLNKAEKIKLKKIKSNRNMSRLMLQNRLRHDFSNMGYSKDIIDQVLTDMDYEDDKEIIRKEVIKAYKKYASKYSKAELTLRIKHYLYTKGFNTDVNIDDYL